MNRNRMMKIIPKGLAASAALGLLMAGCATKEIPQQAPIEPETERPAQKTEGSLWPGETSRSSLFSDKKAAKVGDIITVHLMEQTTASNQSNTKTARSQSNYIKNGLSGDLGNYIQPNIGGGSNFNGGGSTSRSESLYTTITASVIEVLPNGLLRILGQRQVKINDAHQYVQVAGVVRPEDINFDNSIVSSKIANAQIVYDGAGRLDKNQKPAWGGQLLERVSPF